MASYSIVSLVFFQMGKFISGPPISNSHPYSESSAFKKSNFVNGIFLDLSKDFDILHESILLCKLDTWFRNYLNNRD